MSLPDDRVYPLLQSDYVLAWRNIRREDYVGDSLGYAAHQACVGTTNGAGSRNLQILVLSPDLHVLHALPGFWHPADLARELRFAEVLWRLYRDPDRSDEQKAMMFATMERTELRAQPAATYARSDWQWFDKAVEGAAFDPARDTFQHDEHGEVRRDASGAPVLKAINVLVHERIAQRPFVALSDFDFDAFVDYGRPYYDNNAGVDGRGRRIK